MSCNDEPPYCECEPGDPDCESTPLLWPSQESRDYFAKLHATVSIWEGRSPSFFSVNWKPTQGLASGGIDKGEGAQ